MKGARKPKQTAFDRKREKAAAIRELIDNEKGKHARKIKSLSEQTAAARGFASADLQRLALVRLDGQRLDEQARHQEKMRALELRLQKALR